MRQKINLRVAWVAIIAIVTTTVGITLVFYNLFQQRVREDLKINARMLEASGIFQDIYDETSDKQMEDFGAGSNPNLRLTWIDTDGSVLYDNDTDPTVLENHLDRPEIKEALENGEGEIVRHSDTFNMNTFYYAVRLENGTVLRVATNARTITSVFLAAMPVIALIAVLILGMCILISHYLTAQILRPIELMAENIDKDNEHVEQPDYEELRPFADKIRMQHENILAAAKMRQDFTANVSHELKTPLTAISGYAELIENQMISKEQEGHIARQIRRNAERLLSLINDIIRLSELDHSERQQFAEIDLYELARECCDNLAVAARQRRIYLSCQGKTLMVNADRHLIKEMMENLIQNAIRYNKDYGYVQVKVQEEKGHAIFRVKDNGIGIPKESQERVFERFYRVDKSRSRETGGTGLGLAIVKHIAEIHSATIELTSVLGEGTEIMICF